jgi:protein tyrosine/serine phosphatase
MFSNVSVVIFSLVLWSSASFASINKFLEFTPGIYRGSQPTVNADYQMLKNLGVKTIVNLRDVSEGDYEDQIASKFGFTFYRFPMNAWYTPDDSQIDQILNVISDPQNQPVFVHCLYGKDRTGLVVGLHRVLHEGWKRMDAYNEMVSFGFNRIFVRMQYYFYVKTSPAPKSIPSQLVDPAVVRNWDFLPGM